MRFADLSRLHVLERNISVPEQIDLSLGCLVVEVVFVLQFFVTLNALVQVAAKHCSNDLSVRGPVIVPMLWHVKKLVV